MQITSEALAAYFGVILPLLNERQRRLVAAAAPSRDALPRTSPTSR